MMQLLCVEPLIAEPSTLIEQLELSHPQQQHFYSELDKIEFQQKLGLNCWQLWIQEGPGDQYFCIQYLECQNPIQLSEVFKNEWRNQNGYALWLNHLFQTYFSCYSHLMNLSLKIEQVLDLPIHSHPIEGYDFCYMLPLLPQKLEEHKEYCRLAMSDKKESTIAACKAFGMIHLQKWIQETSSQYYVLYYQKMTQPSEKARQAFLALKDNPKALQATQTLREQTGLSFEELSPKVECFTLFPRY